MVINATAKRTNSRQGYACQEGSLGRNRQEVGRQNRSLWNHVALCQTATKKFIEKKIKWVRRRVRNAALTVLQDSVDT